MAEGSEGDKTEPATAKRRTEARESGQVAKSQDLTSAVLLLAGLLIVSAIAKTFVTSMADILRTLLGSQYWASPTALLDVSMRSSLPGIFRILGPIFLTLVLAAFLITALQVGFHVNFEPLMPRLSKLNPIQGLGRMFAGQNWVQFLMNFLKLAIIGGIAWNEVHNQLSLIISLSAIGFPENMAIGAGIVYGLTWKIALALLILAASDWIYHKWKFERDIRMSKQEIKDETKNMDGDPLVKGRRRQMARKMILQRIHRDVPKADVIVTNPTELAIAIQYDQDAMGAPRVVAKGAGFLAQRIRQVAVANGVPIVERKPLAQALYKTVDVGREVPPEFYQTIAEILAYVYELAGKGLRRRREVA